MISFSTIKINVSNLKLRLPKIENKFANENYKITIELYILKKIRIFKKDITKTEIEKIKLNKEYRKLEKELTFDKDHFDLKLVKMLKKLKLDFKKFEFTINIGTQNAAVTPFLVVIISTVLGIILKDKIKNQNIQKYIVNPIYINQNLLEMDINCIFQFEMIHIIYIINMLSKNKKERGNKNVRTSNRRPYGYSYE